MSARFLGRFARLNLFGVHIKWFGIAIDHFCVDHDLIYTAQSGQFEHRVEQDGFHDGAKTPSTGLANDRLLG